MDYLLNDFINIEYAKDTSYITHISKKIQSALFFIDSKKKKYPYPCLVYSKNDMLYENLNIDEIVCKFISSLDPKLIDELKEIKRLNNLLSIYDALRFSIHEQYENINESEEIEDCSKDIEEIFDDNNRDIYGGNICYSDLGKYKRVFHKSLSDCCNETNDI